MSRFGPCMCGATDCPSCGPAQGYTVVKVWRNGRYTHVNPDDGDESEGSDDDYQPEPEPDYNAAEERALRAYEREIERGHP